MKSGPTRIFFDDVAGSMLSAFSQETPATVKKDSPATAVEAQVVPAEDGKHPAPSTYVCSLGSVISSGFWEGILIRVLVSYY